MSKLLLCVALPALVCVWIASIILRKWYLKMYPKTVDDIIEIKEAAEKYSDKLGK